MFATIVEKWNAFKTDWKEYQRLRRVAARAWRKLDRVRGKITVFCGRDGIAKEKRCIKTKFMEVPHFSAMEELGSGRIPPIIASNSYCPYFKGKDLDAGAVECGQTDCPHHSANCEYVNAAKEYEIADAKRRAFWNKTKSKAK
ncbi:MAG: hypothetical protein K2I81_03855 [Alphaproteobacteria bacterium]|nr:hypothetical protein [Alphaproteobacteria bacterium]